MANINQPVIRSISLPSREHPCSVRIEALLNHLKSFQFSSAHVSSFESHTIIQSSLVGLAELYNCVDEFMNSPTTQQALMPSTTRHCENSLVEQALEGSITLLDTCNAAREVLLTMNQHVQTLQSALRRKGGGDSSVEANIHAYLRFRKKAKKDIVAKCLAGLKRMEGYNNNMALSDLSHQENDMSMIVKVLGETSSVTISIFRSLLKLLSTPSSTNTKAINGWSLISKLMRKRLLVPSEREVEKVNDVNLVAKVDVSLHSLLGKIQSSDNIAKSEAVQLSQRMLETLNSSSESLVVKLDCMFRCLVQNRVSLLNILTQY